jgi:hypothetical protein
MTHLLMIFAGVLVVITHLDQFDGSVIFLICLIGLWIWDYNDINRRARKNKYSYYNRKRK